MSVETPISNLPDVLGEMIQALSTVGWAGVRVSVRRGSAGLKSKFGAWSSRLTVQAWFEALDITTVSTCDSRSDIVRLAIRTSGAEEHRGGAASKTCRPATSRAAAELPS